MPASRSSESSSYYRSRAPSNSSQDPSRYTPKMSSGLARHPSVVSVDGSQYSQPQHSQGSYYSTNVMAYPPSMSTTPSLSTRSPSVAPTLVNGTNISTPQQMYRSDSRASMASTTTAYERPQMMALDAMSPQERMRQEILNAPTDPAECARLFHRWMSGEESMAPRGPSNLQRRPSEVSVASTPPVTPQLKPYDGSGPPRRAASISLGTSTHLSRVPTMEAAENSGRPKAASFSVGSSNPSIRKKKSLVRSDTLPLSSSAANVRGSEEPFDLNSVPEHLRVGLLTVPPQDRATVYEARLFVFLSNSIENLSYILSHG